MRGEEALDPALQRRWVWVEDDGGAAVEGRVAVAADLTRWTFTPAAPWRAAPYAVVFRSALEDYPDINIVQEDATGWNFDNGKRLMLDFLASGLPVSGVWTSGIDFVIPQAFQESGVPFVPVVGADSAEFVSQLVGPNALEGLEGAFVTNPASIGGAAVTLALQALNGEIPKTPADAESAVVHITPVLYENVTEEGRAAAEAALDPDLPGTWPVGITVPDWTTYTKEELLACGGNPVQ